MNFKSLSLPILACLIFSLTAACKPKVDETTDAVVTFIKGTATTEKSGSVLKPTDRVPESETVVTEKDAVLDLTTTLGTIRLLGGTEASVAALRADQNYIKVNEGNILVKVVKLNKNESISIDTPTVVAAVRGTQFWGRVNRADETGTFAVREGSVLITRKVDEARVLIKAGEAVDLSPDAKTLKTRSAAPGELAAMEQIDQMK
ncbi:FecR domain-containing protein [Leptospira wolffii]|uniref:FecR domain-containing protein n=1 Tax=Leptospira wolffii TaxID=409998 RepID=A0ABV5BRX6_9LEPT|nr:FecR domain-containing protein [Leptospira wolffii]EPG67565.1 sigma factor regulatory protein, FecR/PupR family [Leptospira wolffii serovar Khorat str. Khorat-H2]TGL51805.1 iron dicitrate transport regulator FecR [Leptospira wolffii]